MQDRYIEFLEHLDGIKEFIIIVEGKNDKRALEKLWMDNIIQLDKKPLYKIVDRLSGINDKVVILTDLDREGKQLYSKLNSALQNVGVRIDNKFRNFLFRKTDLRQIEGIFTYSEKLRRKSPSHFFYSRDE